MTQALPSPGESGGFIPQATESFFLSANVKDPVSAALALRTLGRVAQHGARRPVKDYSDYQRWVRDKYFEEMSDDERLRFAQGKRIKKQLEDIRQQRISHSERIRQILARTSISFDARRRFYNWLHQHDRAAWLVLDPLITVQRDYVAFEAMSMDESVYARVVLPWSGLELDQTVRWGTTNVDYTPELDRELARVRSYRPLHLRVGETGLTVRTASRSTQLSKVNLPTSWVKSFAEVSASFALKKHTVTLSSVTLANVISLLSRRRDSSSGRALIFHLDPQQHPRIEVQPWGIEVVEPKFVYEGDSSTTVRVWGRRRLEILKELLPEVERVEVRLLGDGLPSFWSTSVGEARLTLALTGWSGLDWARKTRLSALRPRTDLGSTNSKEVDAALRQLGTATISELSAELPDIDKPIVEAALATLMFNGRALLDPETQQYVHRVIVEDWKHTEAEDAESRAARALIESSQVAVVSDGLTEEGRLLKGLSSDTRNHRIELKYSVDGTLQQMACSCGNFRLRSRGNAPCRHIIALHFLGGADE